MRMTSCSYFRFRWRTALSYLSSVNHKLTLQYFSSNIDFRKYIEVYIWNIIYCFYWYTSLPLFENQSCAHVIINLAFPWNWKAANNRAYSFRIATSESKLTEKQVPGKSQHLRLSWGAGWGRGGLVCWILSLKLQLLWRHSCRLSSRAKPSKQ